MMNKKLQVVHSWHLCLCCQNRSLCLHGLPKTFSLIV